MSRDLLAFAARLGPAPPLPPLPSDLDGDTEQLDDFTAEERRLEQDCEEALTQLEALDAAAVASEKESRWRSRWGRCA